MDLSEAKAYNALNILECADHKALKKIKEQYGSWTGGWAKLGVKSGLDQEKEWNKLEEHGVGFLFAEDSRFPGALNEIAWTPHALYYKGALPEPSDILISIVGTRKATLNGLEIAARFSERLVRSGAVIVSGLALGIDAAAHGGALAGKGRTIAVGANSLEKVYPRQNIGLAKNILDNNGCLLSEYPIGSETFPSRFLERNRIVSGLSRGTLVIEAPDDSGSLVTANFALEQNREVFVVPGPLNHANYSGSHRLLRAGARLVTTPEDVLEDLNLAIPGDNSTGVLSLNFSAFSENQRVILTALRQAGAPVSVDKISELGKIDIPLVTRNLTFLLIRGIVKEAGGLYHL